jgi:hypothetical protein
MKKFSLFLICTIAIITTSCKTQAPFTQIKGDVIGFSDGLKTSYKTNNKDTPVAKAKPYYLKNEKGNDMNQVAEMQDFIDDLPAGTNTSLYYATERGLDRVINVRKKHMQKSKITKFYSIVFTDGLDNVSNNLGKVKGNDGKWQKKYDKRIQKKIKKTVKAKTSKFQEWVIVLYGEDLQKSGWTPEEIKKDIYQTRLIYEK